MQNTNKTFEHFQFSEPMNKAILQMGFTHPSPIQLETIPILLGKRTDFLGLAATGTGKTAAYGIPLLENLVENEKGVQALILCPTRELAKQVSEQMNMLARYKTTKAIAIYGGSDYAGQLRALKDGVSIVVGTPGRIIDHLDRGTLNLNFLQTVVLDEADEMISMGFKTEIESILERVNQEVKHQTWLFSATMSSDIRRIADQFLESPKQIQINKAEKIASGVKQYFYLVKEHEKPRVIERIIDSNPDFYGLIFCQTKSLVAELTATLVSDGYAADCLHGDMEQNARERTMKAFKARKTQLLVCTDVASRGIDVKDLTHVVNYSIPRELDLYVHRIGRTGRGGKEGIALSLVTGSHMRLVSKIEQTMDTRLTKLNVPSEEEMLHIKLKKSLTSLSAEKKDSDDALTIEWTAKVEKLLNSEEWKTTLAALSKEEIVARFITPSLMPKKNQVSESSEDDGYRDGRRTDGRGRGEAGDSGTRSDRRSRYMRSNDERGGGGGRFGGGGRSRSGRSSGSSGENEGYRRDRGDGKGGSPAREAAPPRPERSGPSARWDRSKPKDKKFAGKSSGVNGNKAGTGITPNVPSVKPAGNFKAAKSKLN